MIKIWRWATLVVACLVVAAACTSTAASLPPSSSASSSMALPTAAVVSPTATPLASGTPVVPPTEHPSPKPSPRVVIWSKPSIIRKGDCSVPTAVIDPAGRYHVAVVCDGGIRYLTSADGVEWKETSLVPPIDRLEVDPQLTLDGSTVHLANSLLAPTDGGCGDDGYEDVGVYTRSLQPSSDAWSDAVQIGSTGDRVQSFRVAAGVLHLTVTSKDGSGPRYYESRSGPDFSRVPIPDAVTTSLRVGDDGHARIAYATGGAIRYARVDGTQLAVTDVVATDKTDLLWPSLVLAPGDVAYIVWTQMAGTGAGCAGIDPSPLDGTYFGTDAGGGWKTTRLTRTPGEASITLDPSSGRIDVVVHEASGLIHYSSANGTDWSSKKIAGTSRLNGPLIRVNPVTGSINIFAFDYDRGVALITTP